MGVNPKNAGARNESGKKARPTPEHVEPTPAEWDEFKTLFKLSRRHLQVAQLLYADCPAKTLAHRLGCTRGTVSVHRAKLYAKTGVHDRTGLVREILEFCIARRSRGSLPQP